MVRTDPSSIPLISLAHLLPERARLMGLDLGVKSIGLALSDDLRRIASPLTRIERARFQESSNHLLALCEQYGVHGLVIGLPLNMNGSEGARAQSARSFVRLLARKTDIPISYWDERLSTAAVARTLLEADASRKRRAAVIDKMAAAYILQGALDRISLFL